MNDPVEISETTPFLIKATPTLGKFHKALAKAQSELKNPEKNQTATIRGRTKDGTPYSYEYDYADLASGLDVIRPVTGKNGIFFYQMVTKDGGQLLLITRIGFEDEWVDAELPLGPSGVISDPQKLGALITFLRRYELFPMVGVAGESDKEGEILEEDPDVKARAMKEAGEQEEAALANLKTTIKGVESQAQFDAWLKHNESTLAGLSSGGKAAMRRVYQAVQARIKAQNQE